MICEMPENNTLMKSDRLILSWFRISHLKSYLLMKNKRGKSLRFLSITMFKVLSTSCISFIPFSMRFLWLSVSMAYQICTSLEKWWHVVFQSFSTSRKVAASFPIYCEISSIFINPFIGKNAY